MTRAAAGASLLMLLALAACTTTSTTISSSQPTPRPDAVMPAEPADAARRTKARLELAGAYFGQGQNETALEEVDAALRISPNAGEGYNLRGLILGALNRPDDAEQAFRRAIEIDANDVDALHNYGWFQCQQRRYDAAQQLFDRVLAAPRGRDAPRTLLVQGICQARAGRLLDADGTLTRAFELDPTNPSIAVNLSEVLLRRNQLDRARFYIRRVNLQRNLANAQTLWLAARIERQAGNETQLAEIGRELRARFPDSREAADFERGQFGP